MVPVARLAAPLLLSMSLVGLAGCADSGADDLPDELTEGAPQVEATDTKGGIRGVVVDDRIVPIKAAKIEVVGTDKTAETDADGLFAVSGLDPGSYLVKASHALYAPSQQNAEVVAGEAAPKLVKFQLVRTVFAEPYYQTIKYDGFIVCSVNTAGVLSEECGEGVGVPGVGRVGGQDQNNVQFDVPIDTPGLASIVFEKVWEPTSEAGNELYTPIGINWVCDPGCAWDEVTEMKGPSPQYAYAGPDLIESSGIVPGQVVTMFTWAGSFEDPAGVALNQQYQDFMTLFYHVPAAEGWSFVGGSGSPY